MDHDNHVYKLNFLCTCLSMTLMFSLRLCRHIHKVMHYPFLVLAHIAVATEAHLFTNRVPGLRVDAA